MATFILISVMLFSNAGDTTFSGEKQHDQDLDRIKLMAIGGEVPAAIEVLEERVAAGEPAEEDVSLLIRLYQQQLDFLKLNRTYNRFQTLLQGNTDATYAYAQAKLQTGYRSETVSILEELRAADTDDIQGRILLGRIYYEDEKWEAAQPVYREITRLNPDNLLFKTQLARIHRNLRFEEVARDELQEILDEDPAFLLAILELVSLDYMNGNLEDAEKLVNRGLELYPRESRLWDLSARIVYTQRQYLKASEHWNRVVDLGDAEMSTHRNLGLCHYQLGEPEKALDHFGKVLAEHLGDRVALMYSAMVYRQLKEWEKAKGMLDLLFEAQTGDALIDGIMQRAVVSEELEDIDAAEADYKLVKLLDPEHSSADFYLAALYDRHMDDKTVALELYQEYLESDIRDPSLEEVARGRVRVLIEQLHFQQGRE